MSTNKGNRIPKDLAARRAAKQQRESKRVADLRACRVAAALTQRDLAAMVGSNQTTIADLEIWDEADLCMLQRLCQALQVAPDDLVYRLNVDDEILQANQEWRTLNGFGDGNIQRRREVNLIKRHGYYADPYDLDSALYGRGSRPPRTVLLAWIEASPDGGGTHAAPASRDDRFQPDDNLRTREEVPEPWRLYEDHSEAVPGPRSISRGPYLQRLHRVRNFELLSKRRYEDNEILYSIYRRRQPC